MKLILAILALCAATWAQVITPQAAETGTATNAAGTTQALSVTLAVGDLVVAECSAPTGDVLTITDGKLNTWTNNPSTHTTPVFSTVQAWSVISIGGATTITCTSNTSGYLIVDSTGYQSTTGWPASPIDQRGSTTQTAGTSLTVTAGGANIRAVEVNVVMIGTNSANVWSVSPSGYTQEVNDPNGFERVYDKITSAVETASATQTFSSAPSLQTIILGTYIPNSGNSMLGGPGMWAGPSQVQ